METDEQPNPVRHRPLRRLSEARLLGGVAAGVADYLDLDPTVVRIAFVALVLFGGAGVPLYLAGWLLIPEDHSGEAIADDVLRHLRLP
jgi:phage shock protein PspC (stress-responsive transcriptional regulator)